MNNLIRKMSSRYSKLGVALSLLLLPFAAGASPVEAGEQPMSVTCGMTAPVADAVFYFEVSMKDGSVLSFPFAEQPTLRVKGDHLVLTTTKEEVELPQGSVDRFTIDKRDGATGIEDVSQKTVMERVGNSVRFSQCKAGSEVAVYDRSGRKVVSEKVAADGTASVSLQELPQGVYIVKSEGVTCKILKK